MEVRTILLNLTINELIDVREGFTTNVIHGRTTHVVNIISEHVSSQLGIMGGYGGGDVFDKGGGNTRNNMEAEEVGRRSSFEKGSGSDTNVILMGKRTQTPAHGMMRLR
jgi:hypothetical protein